MCVGASDPSSQEPVHGRGSIDLLLGGDPDGWLRVFLRVSGYGQGAQTGPWGQEGGIGLLRAPMAQIATGINLGVELGSVGRGLEA